MNCKIINPANDKCKKTLEKFGDFIEADSIEYIDYGKSEEYIIIKNNKKFVIKANGNSFDGGYCNFHEGEN